MGKGGRFPSVDALREAPVKYQLEPAQVCAWTPFWGHALGQHRESCSVSVSQLEKQIDHAFFAWWVLVKQGIGHQCMCMNIWLHEYGEYVNILYRGLRLHPIPATPLVPGHSHFRVLGVSMTLSNGVATQI